MEELFLPSAEYKKSNFLEVDGLGSEDGGSKLRVTSVNYTNSHNVMSEKA